MKHDSRNLKYGSTAMILSVVLIAAIILINFVFSALSSRYAFYTDMTSTDNYTLTDAAKVVLSDVTEEVRILFCHDRDYIESSDSMYDILMTAEYLSDEFEWLNVDFVNIMDKPKSVAKYKTSQNDSVNQTDVIVESGDEWRKISWRAFYVADTDTNSTIWAIKAEETFASAILGVTAAEKPIAYFTTGHEETIPAHLVNTVAMAGYDVKTIDLIKEDISADARMIIISGPQKDFSTGYGNSADTERKGNEISKIDKFLAQDNGALMVFLDPYGDDLPTLEGYLEEWGILFDNNIVKDESESIDESNIAVIGQHTTGNTLGANVIDELANLSTKSKTIFESAGTISISANFGEEREEDENSDTGLGIPTGSYGNTVSGGVRDVSAVFTTSAGAMSFSSKGEEGEMTAADGKFLMTISRQRVMREQNEHVSYVLAANTLCFTEEDYVQSNVFANRDVLYAALKQMGRERVPIGIDFKVYSNNKIEDMTTSQANTITTLLVTALPAAIALTGLVVCIRRKYK